MSLEPGTTLGSYQVTAKIGEGGMGEVYRARDTKLDRDVALKVLPEAFAQDPDRLARFEREAKVLASLNHPNIGHIYGLEEAEGIRALVLELVEGPTLADRIKRGPIQLDEALPIAKQIAEALEAAHEKGIIHRDLKPANIKVRGDGTVKVLDFGLAKALDPFPEGDASQSPTLTAMASQAGTIMGTAAYMSPEQARGEPVDRRADIWAFGVVFYELLTGRRPFEGRTISDTLASVLAREPDLDALPTNTPPAVHRLLRRSLEKEPKKRLRDVAEGVLQLEDGLSAPVEALPAIVSLQPTLPVWQRPVPLLLAGLVLAVISGLAVWSQTRPAPRPVLTPPPSMPLDIAEYVNMALTPDGSRVVYRGLVDGQSHLFVRPLAALEATPLTGLSANPRYPFISPDGNWVGFFDGDRPALQRVSIDGGPLVAVAEIRGFPRGASWGPDNTIIFATGARESGLLRVPMGGGELEVLTTPDTERGQLDHVWPEILPGGKAVLFTITTTGGLQNAQIAVLSLESGDYDVLVPGGSNPRYVPTGHIVYGVGGTLRAVGFDLDSFTVTSAPTPVVEDVFMGLFGEANFAVAQDGSLVYVRGGVGGGRVRTTLVWVDREGREESLAAEPDRYAQPLLSPDGTRLAVSVGDFQRGSDIYIYDIARNNFTQLTFSDEGECCPVWTPDGEHVVFTSTREGTPNLYLKNADGTGEVERLTDSNLNHFAYAWSADGDTLVLTSGADVHTWSSDGAPTTTPLFDSAFTKNRPSMSPDGRWIAYGSDEDGAFNVYVQPFPDVDGGKWKVSTQGGFHPVWSPDGSELFYVSGNAMMVAPITTNPTFQHGNSEVVFEGPYDLAGGLRTFDLSPEGTRFLLRKPADAQTDDFVAPLDLVLVQNWFEELTRLVPTNQ